MGCPDSYRDHPRGLFCIPFWANKKERKVNQDFRSQISIAYVRHKCFKLTAMVGTPTAADCRGGVPTGHF